jgi:ribosomal protein S18 acetylase RimI-like enzyme
VSTVWGPQHPFFAATIQLDQDLMTYPWSAQQWLETSLPTYSVFHTSAASELQGFALYQLSEVEKLAHLLKIAVVVGLRGSGETGKFWETQIVTLRARGYERVYLEVATNNKAAIGFYRKNGFKMLHEIKSFYKDGQNAITMELAI